MIQNGLPFFIISFIIVLMICLIMIFCETKTMIVGEFFAGVFLSCIFSGLILMVVSVSTDNWFPDMYEHNLVETIELKKISTVDDTYYMKEKNGSFYIEEIVNNNIQTRQLSRSFIKIKNDEVLPIKNVYTTKTTENASWFIKNILPFVKDNSEYIISSKHIYYED